jgi:GT2 family glycosyltransferase
MVVPISVILPTHNRPVALARAVESLLGQSPPPEQIILVNDGDEPVDGDLATRCSAAGVALLTLSRAEPSLPASRNLGLDRARCDIALMLEDDATCPPGYLQRLGEFWARDTRKQIAAIGSTIVEQRAGSPAGRLFAMLQRLSGHRCWRPRRCPARYLSLPADLAGQLTPANLLYGAGTSIRTDIARAVRYRDDWPGYAYGEDREFAFRLSQQYPCFIARGLALEHDPAEVTAESLAEKGRTYVRHSLATARSATEGGAGLWMLVVLDLLGTCGMYGLLGLVGRNRRARRAFACASAGELLAQARRLLCGR